MVMKCLLTLWFGLWCVAHAQVARRPFSVVADWRTLDFAFPSAATRPRQAMLRSGDFVPENNVILDVDVHGQGNDQRIFVTTPRLKKGVPATLSEITRPAGRSPRLQPFPTWEWNREGDCEALQSVFRTAVDPCGRMWVIDSGTVDVFGEARRVCPPKLVVFDLTARSGYQLERRYRIPDDQVEPGSLLITVAVDVRGRDRNSCREAFAYIADVTNPALVVYDMFRNRSWRVTNNLFYPYPLHGSFDINGAKFDLMDGVFGLALGPTRAGDRTLYFHSLASARESWVSTRLLRNESNFAGENSAVSSQFFVSDYERSSQSAAEGMDSKGVLFFSLLDKNAIACWDSRQRYAPQNIHTIAKDDVTLQFPTGLKVIGRNVWLLTSRFQNVMVDRVNPAEVNYRVLMAPIADLVRGTPCEVFGPEGDVFPGAFDSENEHRPPSSVVKPGAPGGSYGVPGPSYLPGPSSYSSGYVTPTAGIVPPTGGFGFPQPSSLGPKPAGSSGGAWGHHIPSIPQQHRAPHRAPGGVGASSYAVSSTFDSSFVFRDPLDRFK